MPDQTPSQAIVAASANVTEITDASGRRLTLRTLNVVDQVRLLRAIGPAQSGNEPYVNMVQAAASVTAIDDIPLPFPTNEKQIDAAVARIGDAGFAAIMSHIKAEIAKIEADADAAISGEESPAAGPLMQSAS